MTDLREHIIEPKMYSLKHWLKERDLSRSTFYELQRMDWRQRLQGLER